MKKKNISGFREHAFTLIELLVVISIIGILASLLFVSFTASQRQARDTQRKSDIKQYASSLEAYANSTGGLYPSHTSPQNLQSASQGNQLCLDLSLTNCSYDPTNTGDHIYRYQSNGDNTGKPTASSYVLWVQLEGTPLWWIECSNGKTSTYPYVGWTGPTFDQPTNTITCPL